MVIAVDYSRQIILPGELLHHGAVIFYITGRNESLLTAEGLIILLHPVLSPMGTYYLMNLFDSHKQLDDMIHFNHSLIQLSASIDWEGIKDEFATSHFARELDD